MTIKGLFQILALVLGCVTAQAQVVNESWVQRYNREGVDSSDEGSAVATDHAGNAIVVGYSDSGVTGRDWLIIKYTDAGVPLWTNRYSGPGNTTDQAWAVAVGTNNTVFVTGPSQEGSVSFYATVAYSDAGVPLWTNRYNGSPRSLVVSPHGNLFVIVVSTNSCYETFAWSDAGVPLWTNRYEGIDSYSDTATGLGVGPDGTVFVTGRSHKTIAHYDYATVAYTEAGLPLWTNRYNGPADNDDYAEALAVGSDGTVFVTGFSYNGYPPDGGGGHDYLTIAYSGAGVPLWTNRYNGPASDADTANAVAVGANGTVFVTGYSENASGVLNAEDYATIAYSAMGVPLWTNRYDGPGNLADRPAAITVGVSGTVLVTGHTSGGGSTNDYVTIAYSDTGIPLWTNCYNGPANSDDQAAAMAVGGNGTLFVTGRSGINSSVGYTFDCATIAYSEAGLPLWTNRYNGPANRSDEVAAVAVGTNGTVFVTGKALDTLGRNDFDTIAYSAAGVPLWTNRYNGPGNSDDLACAVAVGPGGIVYVAGYSAGSTVLAYSGAGVPLWTNTYVGVGVGGMAVGPDGTAYLIGSTGGKGSISVTRAVSVAGAPLWTNIHSGPATSAVRVGSDGTVFVTTTSSTFAFSGAGVPLWTNRYNGGTANALAVSPGSTVFVTGISSNDYATIAYSGAGVPLWTNRYNGPGNSIDTANAVGVSLNGTVFVSGHSYNASGTLDYATIAYTEAGVPLWTNRYNGPGNYNLVSAVVVGPDGTVFVSGNSFNGSASSDYATVVYSEAGAPLSTNRYNGPANGEDVINKFALALAPDGVVVAGKSAITPGSGAVSDYAVVKYLTTPDSNPNNPNNLPPATITLLPGGEAQLTFYATPGSSYVLEHSADLTSHTWTPVQTNTAASNGAVPFNYLPLGPLNYWRIRPLP